MFRDSNILVTGGTGSFGRRFIKHILSHDSPHKIVIYSRNEAHQEETLAEFAGCKKELRFILGSVLDGDRLHRAMYGIDYVIHAAALKVVPLGNYNPLEFQDVNIMGTRKVINACIDNNVKRAVFIGTDKAVMPCNHYGVTKAAAEYAWISANTLAPIFSSVRYGNVQGSRGSAILKFMDQRDRGEKDYEITHPECTRYWTDFADAIELVMRAFEEKPGLILASKTKSYKVRDMIKAIYLRADLKITGLREGEKIHETIVNEYEASRANELETYYAIRPFESFDDTILYDREHGKPMTKAACSNDFLSLMSLEEVRERVSGFRQEE